MVPATIRANGFPSFPVALDLKGEKMARMPVMVRAAICYDRSFEDNTAYLLINISRRKKAV